MSNLATQNKNASHDLLDDLAVQKTNDVEKETTTWIFEDNSALELNWEDCRIIYDFVEFHVDNIQL